MQYYERKSQFDDVRVEGLLNVIEQALSGDQLFIFQCLRRGLSRDAIAQILNITKKQLRDRISYLSKKLCEEYDLSDISMKDFLA